MTAELLADLEWRGLIAQTTDRDALTEQLNSGSTAFYIGFDPTAPSLHLGNLVVLLVMRRFQLAGHKPLPLVGGATGLVGDPSGKNEERSLNDVDVVEQWVGRIRTQLSKFLEFDSGNNAAVMTNNLDWTKPLSALDFCAMLESISVLIRCSLKTVFHHDLRAVELVTPSSLTKYCKPLISLNFTSDMIAKFNWVVAISGGISSQA